MRGEPSRRHLRCLAVRSPVVLDCLLLSNDLDQHPLSSSPIKLAVENLLPRAKVEAAIGDRYHHLAAHNLSLEVCVGIVLASAVVPVFADRLVRGQFFQPVIVILVLPALNIVDQKNTIEAACRSSSLPICLLSDWRELITLQ